METNILRITLVSIAMCFACVSMAAQIELVVKNPGGTTVSQWPITTGVPFPQGALQTAERVRLFDTSGKEIPAQVLCTGKYQDGSVRWLMLDFQADVPANGMKMRLEYGPEVKRSAIARPLDVSETDAAILVSTGPLRFAVSKKRYNGIDEAWLNGKLIIAPGNRGGPYFCDDQGREFCACHDPAPEVAVESQGPLRTVITARGWYQNAAGEKKCRFIVRIHAFAGKPYVRLFYTWLMTEDSRKLRFSDIGFRLPMSVKRCSFGHSPIEVMAGKEPYLLQYDCDKYLLSPDAGGGSGEKAPGWITAEGTEARCTLAVKDFWQLFPKELGANSTGIIFHMWPAHGIAKPDRKVEDSMIQYLWFVHEGRILDFQVPQSYYTYRGEHTEYEYRYLRSSKDANALGIAKTHELFVAFAPTDSPDNDILTKIFHEPPICMAVPEWMCASGVFGQVQPYSPERFPEYERLISENFDAEQRMQAYTRDYGMWNYGDAHTTWDMGRRRWHDVYRTWRNTHHGCCRVPWLLYIRSGDPKYLYAGIRNARHVLDEDFCHWTTPEFEALPYPKGKIKGALNDYKGIVHWHSGNRLMDYNSMCDFALWYYHMTGDRWGLEVATDWAEAVRQRFTAPFGSREGAGTMAALIEMYKETWNSEYKRIIDAFFEHMITKVQNHGQDKNNPIGAFPQWENYAPWLERYWDLTHDPRAAKALKEWGDAYCEGYGDACSRHNIGDYINILGYAYLATGDPKYLGRGVWEANRAVRSMYSGDDPLLKGLMQIGQTSLAGYTIQRLPIFMKALATYGRPVAPEMVFTVNALFQLLFERTRPVIDGKPTKVETVEAWISEAQDQEFKITIHTSHTYEKRTYTVRLLSPSGKEILKHDETYPAGSKDISLTVPRDGEIGVYKLTVAAPGSTGQVSYPIVVEPKMPVAFPLRNRIIPAGSEYYLFVPRNITKLGVKSLPIGSAAGSAQITSPDGKIRRTFHEMPDAELKETMILVSPEQAARAWRLNVDGAPALLSLVSEGAPVPQLLLQEAYDVEQCEAFLLEKGL